MEYPSRRARLGAVLRLRRRDGNSRRRDSVSGENAFGCRTSSAREGSASPYSQALTRGPSHPARRFPLLPQGSHGIARRTGGRRLRCRLRKELHRHEDERGCRCRGEGETDVWTGVRRHRAHCEFGYGTESWRYSFRVVRRVLATRREFMNNSEA